LMHEKGVIRSAAIDQVISPRIRPFAANMFALPGAVHDQAQLH
jgi:hypothetical protein